MCRALLLSLICFFVCGAAIASTERVANAFELCTTNNFTVENIDAAFSADGWRRVDSIDEIFSVAFLPLLRRELERVPPRFQKKHVERVSTALDRWHNESDRIFISPREFGKLRVLVIVEVKPHKYWKARLLDCSIVSPVFLARPTVLPKARLALSGFPTGDRLAGNKEVVQSRDGKSEDAYLVSTLWFSNGPAVFDQNGWVMAPYTFITTRTKYHDAEQRRLMENSTIDLDMVINFLKSQ